MYVLYQFFLFPGITHISFRHKFKPSHHLIFQIQIRSFHFHFPIIRDPRGFAVKFYTEEGNWDLVGNNTPIFFIRQCHRLFVKFNKFVRRVNNISFFRDPILFPNFIHTQKRNPETHLKDPDMFWDFISLMPMTTHQVRDRQTDRHGSLII